MIYRRTKESISTPICIPVGCGSPRPRTGKGARRPDPKENHKPSCPPWNGEARGEASMQEHVANSHALMDLIAKVIKIWLKGIQTKPERSPPLWKRFDSEPAGVRAEPWRKGGEELSAVLTQCVPPRHNGSWTDPPSLLAMGAFDSALGRGRAHYL